MKIALVQFEVKIYQDLTQTLKRIEYFLKKAFKEKCQIICFPEDFLFAPFDYYNKKEIEKILSNNQKIIIFFSKKAKENNINIITGTIIRKVKNKLFNSCFVFNNKGEIVYLHDKQKLVPYGFEKENTAPGNNEIKPFIINNIKCGVLILQRTFLSAVFSKIKKKGVRNYLRSSFLV